MMPAYGGGKTYQFTLTQAVPVGGQLTFKWDYNVQALASKESILGQANVILQELKMYQ